MVGKKIAPILEDPAKDVIMAESLDICDYFDKDEKYGPTALIAPPPGTAILFGVFFAEFVFAIYLAIASKAELFWVIAAAIAAYVGFMKKKIEKAVALGAAEGFNYKTDDWAEGVLKATDGGRTE